MVPHRTEEVKKVLGPGQVKRIGASTSQTLGMSIWKARTPTEIKVEMKVAIIWQAKVKRGLIWDS